MILARDLKSVGVELYTTAFARIQPPCDSCRCRSHFETRRTVTLHSQRRPVARARSSARSCRHGFTL